MERRRRKEEEGGEQKKWEKSNWVRTRKGKGKES